MVDILNKWLTIRYGRCTFPLTTLCVEGGDVISKIKVKEMNTSRNSQGSVGLAAGVKEVLATSLSTLGRLHNGEYVLNLHCLESIKDIIRFLRRDNESYDVRRYLGQAKVVQNDLIHIIKVCPAESEDLFDLTIRLLTTLTSSVLVLYGEEIPAEKIGRNIYMNLIEHLQDYKEAFYDIDFWNVICGKLTDLFEIDWAERSESQCLQIEKILVILRNVLHIPADPDREKITENDVSIHDKILWSLRQSQILEFLLYVSSNKSEQRYYLHLLEIFSLILREQNPKLLALSELQSSQHEREKDMQDLFTLREREKVYKNKYKHTRTFESTLVLEGLKSFSGKDVIYHGSLEDMKESVVTKNKKRGKPRNHKVPVQSEQIERRSSFSVRIFLKEFCIEFLNCSYNNLMNVVKEKLLAGKALPNDETFYFWALRFFLDFNCTHNLDIKLISDSVNIQTFHFLQTNMDENFEKLMTEKKKRSLWVRKLHLILNAYHSLLQTLRWMDSSRDAGVREMSAVLKSQIFYVAEYRDMPLMFLTRYEPDLFSIAFLRDLIETTHLSIKLLEDYTKNNKIVVRKKFRKRKKKVHKAPAPEPVYESNEETWNRLKENVYETLTKHTEYPDIPPFDVLSELSDEEQKKDAMKKVQKLLHQGKITDGIGLLRSARRVWPENDHFGVEGMSVEDEVMTLQEICLAELGNEKVSINEFKNEENSGRSDEEDEITDDEMGVYLVSEESFDMMSYKRQLVNKRVVEACAVLLQNYAKNSDHTNHCVIKLLFRIGWECRMPAMMYQASLFSTLLKILNDKYRNNKEVRDFAVHLLRKFQEHALKNKFAFIDLLFWKDPSVALEMQGEAGDSNTYESNGTNEVRRKGRKAAGWSTEEEDEIQRLWKECNPELAVNMKVEWVKSHMIDESKSFQGVKRKLQELGLIAHNASRARINSGKEWTAEEVEELTKFFNAFRYAVDIVSIISDHLTIKRTKKSIRQKLLELGLVSSISQLRKKKGKTYLKVAGNSDESGSSEESDNEPARTYSLEEQKEALKKTRHLKPALEWLRDTIQESIEEDDEETQAYPLLAVEEMQVNALETDVFVDLLRKCGLEEPVDGQVYWKIPKTNKPGLVQIVGLLTDTINGGLSAYDSPDSEDEFEKLRRLTGGKTEMEKSSITTLQGESGKVTDSNNSVEELVSTELRSVIRESSKLDSDSSDSEINCRITRKSRRFSSDRESDSELLYSMQASETMKNNSLNRSESVDENYSSEITNRKQMEIGQCSPQDSPNKGSCRRNWKKRRCISSDVEEVESGDSDEISEKVRKRSRILHSDSDSESNNAD